MSYKNLFKHTFFKFVGALICLYLLANLFMHYKLFHKAKELLAIITDIGF